MAKISKESDIIQSLRIFVEKLNDEEDSLIVVEGLRDARALRNSGFLGKLFMLCHNSNLTRLESEAHKFKKIIPLLDNDREGRDILKRVRKVLNGRVAMDLFYQRKLLPTSKGRIRHVEEFDSYADRLYLKQSKI